MRNIPWGGILENMNKILLFCFLLLFNKGAFSHPVIYKDGIVTWVTLTGDSNESRVSYSLTSRFGIEANSSYYENVESIRDYSLGLNFLYKRWIQKNSQANLYGQIHGGYFKKDRTQDEGFLSHASIMADWESREWFVSGKVKGMYLMEDFLPKYNFRIGFAPYVAGMNALQTWMIVQLSYFQESKDQLIVTPLMRFFYRNALWEIGANLEGNFFLSLMTHI